MEVMAQAKWIRRTPRKARLVADAVRGLRVDEALTYLRFMPNHAAREVASVIKSAAANAEHNYELERSSLRVKELKVDEGNRLRRFRPRARGLAHGYVKRTCHITVVVDDGDHAQVS